jgi:hypothetical protein
LALLFHRPIVDKLLAVAAKKIVIQAQKLDSFCDQHTIRNIDFLKIDTEGSELNVLLGARSLLREKRIGILQFEYGGTYTDAHIYLKDVYDLLKGYGYTIYKIVPGGLAEISVWDSRLETFNYSNFLAAAVDI